jgi:hypothetical protein
LLTHEQPICVSGWASQPPLPLVVRASAGVAVPSGSRDRWGHSCVSARLDAAFAAVYGWPVDLTDDAILELAGVCKRHRSTARATPHMDISLPQSHPSAF